jgi:TctA family transporter
MAYDYPVATILLGYVLGPLVEENFRRALLLSRGDLTVFFQGGISGTFMGVCILLVVGQLYFAWRAARRKKLGQPDDAIVIPAASE